MGDATIFGAPNHGLNSANTWTGGPTITGYEVANLADARLSETCRFLYPTEASTWARLAITSGQYREVGGVAVVLTNLWRSATRNADTGAVTAVAQWRVRASQTNFQTRVRPDAIAASTNLTGTAAAVQGLDPEQPSGGSWLTATAPGSVVNARFTFPTLGGLNLKTGAGLQLFRMRVRRTSAGTGNPVLTVELYEGAALKATLTPSKTTSFTTTSTGELVTAAWNASDLADVTGASLEVRVSATTDGGSTLEFGVSLEQRSDFVLTGTHDYDSGWLPAYLPNSLGVLPCNQYHLLSSTIRPDYVQLDFADSTNSDGYVEIGLPVVGPRYTFGLNNVVPGAAWALVPGAVVAQTVGGATRADGRPMRRRFRGTWENFTDAEAYDTAFDRVAMHCGSVTPFVFIFDPATPARYPHTAAYARLVNEPEIVHPYDDGRTFAIELLEEVA